MKTLLIPRRKLITGVAALAGARVLERPALGQTYAGTAAPPAQATEVGYVNCTFYDDFTSLNTIDLKNTQAPGYNWYISNHWPNANDIYWKTQTPISPSSVRQSGSILSCGAPIPSGTAGTQLASACAQPGKPSAYNGSVFGNGFYAECSMAWDTPSSAGVPCPAFWSFSLEPCLDPTFTNYYEIDFLEHYDNTVEPQHFAIHQWFAPGSSTINSNFPQDLTFMGLTYTNQNIYGCRWVPMAQNDGHGKFNFYVNNILIPSASITYSATALPSVPFSPVNSAGIMSGIDTQHQVLYIGWGASGTVELDWVKVWQL
jgi:hypothetical protein